METTITSKDASKDESKDERWPGRPFAALDTFESIDAFLEAARKPASPQNWNHTTAVRVRNNTGEDNSWIGLDGKTLDDGWSLLGSGGWAAGAARIETLASELPAPALPAYRRKPRYADDGDDFDRERYRAGRDDCWRVATPEASTNGRRKAVRIYVGTGVNAGIAPDDYFWSGAVACALASVLDRAGIQTEIIAYSTGTHFYTNQVLLITLKAINEPLALERLAAWTAHACAFRLAIFNYWASIDRRGSSGWGTHDYDGKSVTMEPGDLHVKRMRTERDARAELTRLVEIFTAS